VKTPEEIVDAICRDAHQNDWTPESMAKLVAAAVAIGVERERANTLEALELGRRAVEAAECIETVIKGRK